MKDTPIIASFNQVNKFFDEQFAIENFNLDIQEKEFLALLGPSGCGKSTLLKILAGFEEIDSGQVVLRGKQVTGSKIILPPEKRGIGMVFQDYALFPHLSIFENIAFGLDGSRREKKERVEKMLTLVGMEGQGHKMPHMISGGQQQRVAVARALAPKPALILLDEPFSNLDYRLRIQLREEISEILRHEEVSVILVTHDQTEAFTFADRIVMMQDGKEIQVGTPVDIYQKPVNPWIASFVGDANFIEVDVVDGNIKTPFGVYPSEEKLDNGGYLMMVRPEDVEVVSSEEHATGTIRKVCFLGDSQKLILECKNVSLMTAKVPMDKNWKEDQLVQMQFKKQRLFPA